MAILKRKRANTILLKFIDDSELLEKASLTPGWYLSVENNEPDSTNNETILLRKLSVEQIEKISEMISDTVNDIRPINSIKEQNRYAETLYQEKMRELELKIQQLKNRAKSWSKWTRGFWGLYLD